MIVEEKLRKGEGFVARKMNQLGLKLKQVQIVDWNPEWCLVFYDTDDVQTDTTHTHESIGGPLPHRGPGRPPNPPKEAA